MSSPDPNSSGPQNSDDVATETGVQVELPAVGAAAAADEPRTAARPAAGSTAGSVLAVDDIEGGDREASADADSSFAGMRRREMSVTEQARRTLGDGASSEHKTEHASIATDGSKASPRDRSAMIVGVMLVFSSVASTSPSRVCLCVCRVLVCKWALFDTSHGCICFFCLQSTCSACLCKLRRSAVTLACSQLTPPCVLPQHPPCAPILRPEV